MNDLYEKIDDLIDKIKADEKKVEKLQTALDDYFKKVMEFVTKYLEMRETMKEIK